jgi:enhancing lycopene biosynthesis protein 2
MSARVGVVLSGCGYLDGTEIHEAVSILIALDRRGAEIVCMAPNEPQADVINHITNQPQQQRRNVLEESARIARGNVQDIAGFTSDDLDALIFPGGYGAAKNLSTFASEGPKCRVNQEVARLLKEMHEARKPIGLACISPVLAARVFGAADIRPRLTIGSDRETAKAINAMGGEHHNAPPADAYVDHENLIVSTPCYMNDVGPWVVYEGAEKMVEEVLRMAGDTASVIRGHTATFPVRA